MDFLTKRSLEDYTGSCEVLLEKLSKPTTNLALERLLCIELYITLNSLNPYFMQELFKLRETNKNVGNKHKLNLDIPVVTQVIYGSKSLRSFGPKMWVSLSHQVKFAENLEAFKKLLIAGMAFRVSVLFVTCKTTFHKKLLVCVCLSIFIYIYIYIYILYAIIHYIYYIYFLVEVGFD